MGAADVVPAEHLPTLRPLAHVVLPQELGPRGLERTVEGFLVWLRGYREGAEMDHGYGTPRVRRAGPPPAGRYPAQLAALEREARSRGSAFPDLDADARRAIVATAIDAAGVKELPARPDGGHVATDLMSPFFRSADADDLCYQAEIGRASPMIEKPVTLLPEPDSPTRPRTSPGASSKDTSVDRLHHPEAGVEVRAQVLDAQQGHGVPRKAWPQGTRRARSSRGRAGAMGAGPEGCLSLCTL